METAPHERTLAKLYDIKKLKLGKRAPRVNLRAPVLAAILKKDLPPPPPTVDWTLPVKMPWGVLRNDALGDCTAAGIGHLIQLWTANNGIEATITDDQTIAFYSATTGYNPADPNTDQGGVELDVLKWWQANAFGGQYRMDSFAFVNPKRPDLIRSAIYLMGGIYIGLDLPISCQNQAVWDLPPGGPAGDGEPGSWGGHAVAIVSYDDKGLTCITWGNPWKMTWAFFAAYCDEAYAILSPLWYGAHSPVGIDRAALANDMAEFQAADQPGQPADVTAEADGDGALAKIHVGKVTVSITQSLVNLLIVIIGGALVAMGKLSIDSAATLAGAAMALIGGAWHLSTLHNSNVATRDYMAQVVQIIASLSRRR